MSDNKISTYVATAVGLGAIIGAGIFTLSGTVIALAGYWSLLAFLMVGTVAMAVSLEIGELVSIFPEANGAAYSYVYEAFGSELGFITGVLLYFSFSSSIAVVALGFASYLASLIGVSVATYGKIIAIGIILVLTLVNLMGIRKAARVDFVLVVIKISILLIFIAYAFNISFALNGFENLTSPPPSSNIIDSIFRASVAIFFAYSGFQTISTIAMDVRGGPNSAAKAILSSVLISMAIYILVAISLLFLVPARSYSINADPLAFALNSVHAPYILKIVVDIGALIATTSATLAMILSSSRVLYQISVDGLLPKSLRAYNKERDVAKNGVIISAIIGIIMLFSGNVYIIASISNFGLLFSYLIVGFALLHFRRRGVESTFSSPMYPYLTIVATVGILAFMFGMPREALQFGIILLLGLIGVYYFLVEFEKKKPEKIKLFK